MLKVCLRVRALDKVKNVQRVKLKQAQMDGSGKGEKDIGMKRTEIKKKNNRFSYILNELLT